MAIFDVAVDASVEAKVGDRNNLVDAGVTVCDVAIEMGDITAEDDIDESNDFEVVVVVVINEVVSVGVVLVIAGVVDVVVDLVVVVVDVVVVDVVVCMVDSDGVVVLGVSVVDSIDLEQTVLETLFHSHKSGLKKLKRSLKYNITIGENFQSSLKDNEVYSRKRRQ